MVQGYGSGPGGVSHGGASTVSGYAQVDTEVVIRLRGAMGGDATKQPTFFIVEPQGPYATPHAAPRFNQRTGESHALGCRCEKCCPESGCACYACAYERFMRLG